jgi:hypothetical protein
MVKKLIAVAAVLVISSTLTGVSIGISLAETYSAKCVCAGRDK